MNSFWDIPYKRAGNRSLHLDITIPDGKCPLIIWIHGGGWRFLSRAWNLMAPMTSRGYAVAAVDYRYSDEALFPAQIKDVKDALLFLRENGDRYGYDGERIIVSGDSAGGHLAALMGTSVGYKEWEREGGNYRVDAVVDFYGPIDFVQSAEERIGSGIPLLEVFDLEGMLLGAPAHTEAGRRLAAAASPLTYITPGAPPFLILHGSEDPAVSPDQSRLLRNGLEEAGAAVHMYLIPGGVHALGGTLVYDVIQEFLDYYVKGIKTVDTPPIEVSHERRDPLE